MHPHRSPLTNQAIGAVMHPDSMAYINEMSAQLGYSPKTVTLENLHELMEPARMAFIGVHVAKKYYFEGRHDQAILWLKVALDNNHPDKPIIVYNMGVSYSYLESWQEALDCFLYAQEAGYSSDKKTEGAIATIQAKIRAEESKSKLSLDDSGMGTDISQASYHYAIGNICARAGKWDAAIEFFAIGRELALQELGLEETHGTPLGETNSRTSSFSSGDDSGIFD